MRQKVGDIEGDYDEKKTMYDNMAAGLESNQARLEQVATSFVKLV